MTKDDTDTVRREALVIAQSGGIEPMFEAFYLESLIYAAGRAMAAFDRYDQCLIAHASDGDIVAAIHEALTHAAATSRFFWPVRPPGIAGARATKLRAAFGLNEQSPLYDRNLRNALEHYDERLDLFLLQDVVGYLFPGPMVGPSELADDVLGHIFRLVDPDAEVFVLLGEKHAFGAIRQAVAEVLQKAHSLSESGGRLSTN